VFPFFIVKNWEVSLSGGFVMHRVYLKDEGLRDFGWQATYMNSASRWFDTYFGAGVEVDEYETPTEEDPNHTDTRTDFVLETGFKFRANVEAIKWLSWATPFWGFRAGIKNYGFSNIDRLTYVLEFGARPGPSPPHHPCHIIWASSTRFPTLAILGLARRH
jgi:hypothetical protein